MEVLFFTVLRHVKTFTLANAFRPIHLLCFAVLTPSLLVRR